MTALRTPGEALAAARAEARLAPDPADAGMCLAKVRELYLVPRVFGSAAEAFAHTTQRGKGPPPAGALLWFTGGSKGKGHVALAAAGLRGWSIDIKARGHLDLVTLSRLRGWSTALHYEGWSRDINGHSVLPFVSLARLQSHRPDDVEIVARALAGEALLSGRHVNGTWDDAMVKAYAAWQERCGYGPATPGTKGPSDGVPGAASLTALGLKRGFAT